MWTERLETAKCWPLAAACVTRRLLAHSLNYFAGTDVSIPILAFSGIMIPMNMCLRGAVAAAGGKGRDCQSDQGVG
jgi:hypothetical protein